MDCFNSLPSQRVAFLGVLQDLRRDRSLHRCPLPTPHGRGRLGSPLLQVGLPSWPSALTLATLVGSCPATCHTVAPVMVAYSAVPLGDRSWFHFIIVLGMN